METLHGITVETEMCFTMAVQATQNVGILFLVYILVQITTDTLETSMLETSYLKSVLLWLVREHTDIVFTEQNHS